MTMDDQERQRRREGFKKIGREQLRLRLEHRRGEYDGEVGREAERWLLEQDVAAWISAWPIIKQWIR